MSDGNLVDLEKIRLKKDLDRLNYYCANNELLVERAIDLLERIGNIINDDMLLREIDDFLDDARQD